MKVVAVDIGGTHARFALAEVAGSAVALGKVITLATKDFGSFEAAWREFAGRSAEPLPERAGIAVAAPVGKGTIRFTNNTWTIDRDEVVAMLALSHCAVINDFEAVGHAIAAVDDVHLEHLAGPHAAPAAVLSVIGPGTGLGVAQVWLLPDGTTAVQASEGGHATYAATDALDDALIARIRRRHARVSNERAVSGPALPDIYAILAEHQGLASVPRDERELWAAALSGADRLAEAAAMRLCASLGSVAGDIALIHGSSSVVIAGGLGLRLRDLLPRSEFAARFQAKGRFEERMASLPVHLLVHPQPGLLGAALCAARR